MKETESNWFVQHPEIDQKFRGEYVAISGKRVIAHGKVLKDVMDKAHKMDLDPLIYKVPSQDILAV